MVDEVRMIKTALAMLVAALARRNASEVDNAAWVKVSLHDLSDLPVEAVERACDEFRRGTLGDGVWCPTSAQIRQEALKIAERSERGAPPGTLMIPDEHAMADIRKEARKIASHAGLPERGLQAEWGEFVAGFRRLGSTKLRWYEEWAKHCRAALVRGGME